MILIAAQIFVFPYVSKNFATDKIGDIISTTLYNSLQIRMYAYYFYFQIATIFVLFLLFVLRNKFVRIFNFYVLLGYITYAVLQNLALTDAYGFSIVTINVLMFLLVAYTWMMEILSPENDYTFSNLNWGTSWLIVLSIIAFWFPFGRNGIEFDPKYFIYNGSSLAFCTMTPVFLTIMTLNIPKINIVTYRITAIIGVILGLYNMMNFLNPRTVDLAILHLPLLLISVYATIKSFRIKK